MTAPVLLVRHAEAGPGGPDAERRLTERGREDFAALLAALGPRLTVHRILASPFRRARETAEILSRATGAPVEEVDELASGACGGRELLQLARRAGPGTALVGHNPEVAEALAVVARSSVAVHPGTIAAVELDGTGGRMLWVEAP